VQKDFAVVARQDGRDREVDLLQGIVGVRAGEQMERGRHAAKIRPAPLKRLDRIGEACRCGIGGDGLDCRAMFGQHTVERRTEMRGPNAVERRQAERRFPGGEQRVVVAGRGRDCRRVVHSQTPCGAMVLRKTCRKFAQVFTVRSLSGRSLEGSKRRLPAAGAQSPALSGIAKGRVNVFMGSASSRRLPFFFSS
jgi:hypothetical protein